MAYQVLARKWRPQNFTQLVGQEHVSQSLCNALKHDRLHHAYLFTGTRGVGKTTIARILAKAINCKSLNECNPCGECDVCHAFEEGRFLDLIEVDAASRTKVEDTRDLLDNAQYAPNQGRYKVYIIDEIHMLSGHSFNALLKTLEEPPEHVKFLLATTDPQKIPVTILSRCLQFNLKQLLPEQIKDQMGYILGEEKIVFEPEALKLLSRAADGSMRDGLSILDQAISFGNGEVRLETVTQMLGTVAQQPIDNILFSLAENNGAELLQHITNMTHLSANFADILQQILRTLHRVSLFQAIDNFKDSEFDLEVISQLSEKLLPEDVQLFYQIALIGQRDLDLAPDPRSGFEMVMLRMLTFKPTDVGDEENIQRPNATVKIPSTIKTVEKKRIKEPAIEVSSNDKTDNQWADTIVMMKLGGMTRELANNCMLKSLNDNSCHLTLDSGHSQLLSSRAEEKLQNALQAYYSKSIKLTIKIEKTDTITTPAQQITQQRKDKQQAAVDSINADENINVLKEQFDARILPGTIEPR